MEEELAQINKTDLIKKLSGELPQIREELSLSQDDIERMTNIGAKRINAIEEGRREMKWSEYLSIVFVLWSNDVSKDIVNRRGLFPPELKRAFSVNRNAHD